MAMNRRNVLIGLGTVAAGGGAAIGTGAFSQVEAERNVGLTPAGDGSANVEISVDEASNAITTASGSSNTIGIDGANLNYDAITNVNQVLTITVSSDADSDYSIDLLDDLGGSTVSNDSEARGSDAEDIQFVANDGASSGTVTYDDDGSFSAVSPGEFVVYDVTFNLLGDTASGEVTVPFTNDTVVINVN